jgi:hypothetical protein
VRARTQADVALLRAPRVAVSAIRFPSSNRIDLGPTVGENYQARAAIAFSPLDFYRGSVLQDATEADCRVHDAVDRMRVELEDLTDLGRLSALRAQAAYLTSHRAEWNAFLAKASEQLAARLLTAVEYDELRRLTQGLERKIASVESEADLLESRSGIRARPAELGASSKAYVAQAVAAERAFTRLRALDSWGFKITGGVIPPLSSHDADWFGFAELSYSLGGPWHDRADAGAAEARADEVTQARDELPARLDDIKRALAAELATTKRELAVVEGELSSTEVIRAALEGGDSPNLDHARAILVVERLDAESDRVFLRALIGDLVASIGDHDGP